MRKGIFLISILILPFAVLGQFGNAVSFNGTSNYGVRQVPVTGVAEITMESWMNMHSSSGNGILFYYGSTGARGFGLFRVGNVINYLAGGSVLKSTGLTIPLNEWHHWAISRGGIGDIKIFKDGYVAYIDTLAATNAFSTDSLNIGGRAGIEYTQADFDEFRFWTIDRSAAEILANKNVIIESNSTNLRVNYHFDESNGAVTALDATTFSNKLALRNGPTYAASGLTISNNKSVQFNGVSARVRVTDLAPQNGSAIPNAFKISGTAITLEAWVNLASLPTIGTEYLVMGRPATATLNTDPYYSYALRIKNESGNARFNFHLSDGTEGSSFGSTADTVTIETGKWYHLSGTFDGSSAKIYVNGQLKSENITSGNSISTGEIGFYVGGTVVGYFNGLIDEVRLWNVTRSSTEINLSKDSPLFGYETGLAGYWPFETSTPTITPDKTNNHNDLAVQSGAQLINIPVGTVFEIKPSKITISNLSDTSGGFYSAKLGSDGFPTPAFSADNLPEGMTLEGDSLKWEVPNDALGIYNLDLTVTNSAGSIDTTFYLYIESFHRTTNLASLDVATRGKVGNFGQSGRGMTFNSKQVLFYGDFSLVDRNDSKYAGGLGSTTNSFHPLTGFETVSSSLPDFTAARSTMDDSWESNRINVKVLQTVHTKTTSPDDKYSILEYQVVNTSGSVISDLFAQFTTDFDIGISGNNKGGYDSGLQLVYTYENGGATNSDYAGIVLLNKYASGAGAVTPATLGNYIRKTAKLTAFDIDSTSINDFQNQITTGPFNLQSLDTLRIVFAVLAGEDLADLKNSATAAKVYFSLETVPVELVRFKADKNNKGVVLNWSTKSETNNAGWEIEQGTGSKEQGAWQKIGFVAGKGTTSEAQSYSYSLPFSRNASQLFFRLKQIDNDGKFSYSSIEEVSVLTDKFELVGNYPNPFNPTTKIAFNLPKDSKVRVSVSNVLGQEIAVLADKEFKAGNGITVDFNAADFSTGIYFYTINVDGKSFTKSMTLIK